MNHLSTRSTGIYFIIAMLFLIIPYVSGCGGSGIQGLENAGSTVDGSSVSKSLNSADKDESSKQCLYSKVTYTLDNGKIITYQFDPETLSAVAPSKSATQETRSSGATRQAYDGTVMGLGDSKAAYVTDKLVATTNAYTFGPGKGIAEEYIVCPEPSVYPESNVPRQGITVVPSIESGIGPITYTPSAPSFSGAVHIVANYIIPGVPPKPWHESWEYVYLVGNPVPVLTQYYSEDGIVMGLQFTMGMGSDTENVVLPKTLGGWHFISNNNMSHSDDIVNMRELSIKDSVTFLPVDNDPNKIKIQAEIEELPAGSWTAEITRAEDVIVDPNTQETKTIALIWEPSTKYLAGDWIYNSGVAATLSEDFSRAVKEIADSYMHTITAYDDRNVVKTFAKKSAEEVNPPLPVIKKISSENITLLDKNNNEIKLPQYNADAGRKEPIAYAISDKKRMTDVTFYLKKAPIEGLKVYSLYGKAASTGDMIFPKKDEKLQKGNNVVHFNVSVPSKICKIDKIKWYCETKSSGPHYLGTTDSIIYVTLDRPKKPQKKPRVDVIDFATNIAKDETDEDADAVKIRENVTKGIYNNSVGFEYDRSTRTHHTKVRNNGEQEFDVSDFLKFKGSSNDPIGNCLDFSNLFQVCCASLGVEAWVKKFSGVIRGRFFYRPFLPIGYTNWWSGGYLYFHQTGWNDGSVFDPTYKINFSSPFIPVNTELSYYKNLLLLPGQRWIPQRQSMPRMKGDPSTGVRGEEDDNDEIEFTLNPSSILSQELMPGFQLRSSEIDQDKKTKEIIIVESWNSSDGTNVKFDLYPCKSYKDALATAEKLFYATMDDDQEPGGGAPLLGSLSGQTIGDVCWAYKDSGLPEEKTDDSSRSLLFIKGNSLVSLLIYNHVTKSVSVNFAEDIAKKIVSRIK